MENLEQILESLLFVAGEPVAVSDITAKWDVTKAEVEKAAKKLQAKYNKDCGINLLIFNGKLQFSSNPIFADPVSVVLNPIRQRNLTKATMETASIIAYKQPITRLEIEEIRGVSSDYALGVLLDHKLVEVVGKKDAVGKPLLFGTTDEFLKRFNLGGLEELPNKESLLKRIETIKTNSENSLYNNYEISTEEIIPEKVKEKLKEAARDASKIEKASFVDNETRTLSKIEDYGSDDFKFV